MLPTPRRSSRIQTMLTTRSQLNKPCNNSRTNPQTKQSSKSREQINERDISEAESEGEIEGETVDSGEQNEQRRPEHQLHKESSFYWAWPLLWAFVAWQLISTACQQGGNCSISDSACVRLPANTTECLIRFMRGDTICISIQIEGDGNVPDSVLEVGTKANNISKANASSKTHGMTVETSSLPNASASSAHSNTLDKYSSTNIPYSTIFSSTSTSTSISPVSHLTKLADTIEYAVFPVPYFTSLSYKLDTNRESVYIHVPFIYPGDPILPYLDVSSPSPNITGDPNHPLVQKMKGLLGLAEDQNTKEEDRVRYLAEAEAHYLTLISLGSNYLWQAQVFDLPTLLTHLDGIYTGLFKLALVARSLEATLSEGTRNITSLLSSAISSAQFENSPPNPNKDPAGDKPVDYQPVAEAFTILLAIVHDHLNLWNLGREVFNTKLAAVRAQLEQFIAMMHERDFSNDEDLEKEIGWNVSTELSLTSWMRNQIFRGIQTVGDAAGPGYNVGDTFWGKEMQEALLILKEMDAVVKRMEERWKLVESVGVPVVEKLEEPARSRSSGRW